MGYLYILGSIIFTLYGQLIIKWRIANYGSLPEIFTEKIHFFCRLLLDPFIISSFASAFIASLFWMAAMTKFELSHAYPVIIGGLALLTTFFSIIILKESVSMFKILGLALVVIGIYIINK